MDRHAGCAAAVAAGETTSLALTERCLARIAATNSAWHVFIAVLADSAVAAARASDARRASGRALSPIDGIPIAIKDNIDVAGIATTAGALAYRDRVAAADAGVVARLKAAGAVILGKVNMHEMALGGTTDNPTYGRCANPLAPDHSPGGSSGGSAAAVAGGLAPIALGTDTMGSVRLPSSYCGTFGLKPTPGLVGRSGLVYLSRRLDSIGVIAGNAADLALATQAIAGPDAGDADSLTPPPGWNPAGGTADLAGAIFGRPDAIALVACEPEVLSAFAECEARLEAMGARIAPVTIPGWNPAADRRAGLLLSEREVAESIGARLDQGGFSAEFRASAEFGRRAPSEKIDAARRSLDAVAAATLLVLRDLDGIILPTTPQRAFPFSSRAPSSQADFTALANIAGLPAVAFPLAVDGGLPASAQIIGHTFAEGRLIAIAGLAANYPVTEEAFA